MSEASTESATMRLTSPGGLSVELNANGSLRRMDCGAISLTLFPGNELEGGPANLYLRRRSHPLEWTPLLGPRSATQFMADPASGALVGAGSWHGIGYSIALLLAREAAAWFWHVRLENTATAAQSVDLTYAQDLALAPYGAVRLNEFYVSQYIDHTPLSHAPRGLVVASRQNQAVDGRYPWSVIGSLGCGVSFATDALQFHGLESRRGAAPIGLTGDLPGHRLQHEHSMVVIRDQPIVLEAGCGIDSGFFGLYRADHPEATSSADLGSLSVLSSLPEAAPLRFAAPSRERAPGARTLFSAAPVLEVRELDDAALKLAFGSPWRHEEFDDSGRRLSFTHGVDRHVVLRAKELRVLRPHGHILRSGRHLTPDETALTSTVWMGGVFHSMVTQGHVSINRFLSTVHSYLGLFRSHGQRVFVELDGRWQLLDIPSAFEMAPDECRWIYRHEQGQIEVRAAGSDDPQTLVLELAVSSGDPPRFLVSHHVALNDDDGSTPGAALWRREGSAIVIAPAPGSALAGRFPDGSFCLEPEPGTRFAQVGGDELLFLDARSRRQPFVCLISQPTRSFGLRIRGRLVAESVPAPLRLPEGAALSPALPLRAPAASPLRPQVERIADIVPWFTHNALVHYLSPRGLEQYSGGGWGTRDVCQGPVEVLLALDRIAPVRDLLLRVMAMQNPDGDWPQWFMFFDRERGIRAGDSHGDIVFWPLLVLAQYLIASADAGLLDERVAFFDARGPQEGEQATVWQHAQRALALVARRVIPGTALAAYGHGDWNDALQPADPRMREHLCSAWTVTLHFQMLTTLAHALRTLGRSAEADPLQQAALAVQRDFQRLLLIDGVLAGYASFEEAGRVRYLLHPSDDTTGVHYSSLAIVHAILEDLLTPEQAREHLRLIDAHLSANDGLRLFDRPMHYNGGPQRLFQRAESATYFGREIGLMYMHAHLRYAQALAHMGEAQRFFHALCQANPIAIRALVPNASLRQANCYYSSSDAAFADRYQASREYQRVAQGSVALDGGWRVYSSGAGIALGLIMRRFLGLSFEVQHLIVDPVMPAALDGLRFGTTLRGRALELHYRIRAAGAGVRRIVHQGQELAFVRDANPHRPGAVRVRISDLFERLGANSTLTIELD
jgi:1,2-beta-oligoglucan phosphorylase